MNRFQFVADHSEAFEVKRLCQVVGVARSSYYDWLAAAPRRAVRASQDAALAAQICDVQDPALGGDRALGSPRVTAELNEGRKPSERVNRKRVARVMREHGIAGIRLHRRVRTTMPDPSGRKHPDLLQRDFTAPEINSRYVGDITYVPIADGTNWYLATVIDLHSRKLVGWALADHMRTELVVDALRMAHRCEAAFGVRSSTPTTGRSTAPRPTPRHARATECCSRWARSDPVRTTRWRSRSTPPTSARPLPARQRSLT